MNWNMLRPLAKDRDSSIKTNIEKGYLPVVIADKGEILRVINNLLSNAIKHNTIGTAINISAIRTITKYKYLFKTMAMVSRKGKISTFFKDIPQLRERLVQDLAYTFRSK